MTHKRPLTIEVVLTLNQASPDTEALLMSLRVCTQGVGGGRREEGGGNRSLFIFVMWLSPFLRRYRAASSVVVWLFFSSGGSFVRQEEEFNTQTPGVNNGFDLTDKPMCVFAFVCIKVLVRVCVCCLLSALR